MGVQQSVIAPEKVVEGSNAAKEEKPKEKAEQKRHAHRDITVGLPPLHRSHAFCSVVSCTPLYRRERTDDVAMVRVPAAHAPRSFYFHKVKLGASVAASHRQAVLESGASLNWPNPSSASA